MPFRALLLLTFSWLFLTSPAGASTAPVTPKEVELSGAGRYQDVLALLETKDRATLPVMSLTCLCGAYLELKRFRELPACLDALDQKLASGDRLYYGLDLSAVPELMRGHEALELGRRQAGLDHARSAERIVAERGIALYFKIKALSLAGLAFAINGDKEAALDRAHKLSALKLGPQEELLVPDRAAGVARIQLSLGRYAEALAALQFKPGPITQLAKQMVGDSILLYQELPYAYVRAKSLLETGKTGEAKSSYDALLKAPSIREFGSLYRALLLDRGRIAETEGKPDEAIDLYQRAVQEIERQRANLDADIDKIGFLGDKLEVYAALIRLLIARNQPEAALECAERAKSRALVDLLAQQRAFAPRGPDQDGRPIQSLLDELDRAEETLRARESPATGKERLRSLSVRLRQDIQRLDPEIASLVSVEAATGAEIRSLLAPDETLLEFYLGEKEAFVFVLSRETVQARALGVAPAELGRLVADVRKALARPEDQSYLAPAQALYAALLGPMPEALSRPNLLLVPHGPLHYLPFAALHDGRSFLADKAALRTLPSATVLRFLAPRAQRGAPLSAWAANKAQRPLILAAPALGNPALDLPGAALEAERIRTTLGDATVLLGARATLAALRQRAGEASLLHFAAHGIFEPEQPLDSGLLLTPSAGDDGRLRAADLFLMRIAATLTTLSACETGLGAAGAGDEVIGLTRGFLFAGSAGVLASLWEVSDQATAELMAAFYGNLETLAPAAALRRAALATRERWPHPFYWAAFQLAGGW
jgi:CHAT domain-containing protein